MAYVIKSHKENMDFSGVYKHVDGLWSNQPT